MPPLIGVDKKQQAITRRQQASDSSQRSGSGYRGG
jgi:hypothetical protein